MTHEAADVAEIERECGVGVVVSQAEVEAGNDALLAEKKDALAEKGYALEKDMIAEAKTRFRFAEPKMVMTVLLAKLKAHLGEKSAGKKPKAKAEKPAEPAAGVPKTKNVDSGLKLSRPADNKQKTPEILAEHLERTGSVYVTRFPPEPNGYLHIGHAKSMFLNFGSAKTLGGNRALCVRSSDTHLNTAFG